MPGSCTASFGKERGETDGLRRFAYVCADPGIPVPGTKGASIHVASVCRALVQEGLEGEVYTVRPAADTLHGLPVRTIDLPPRRKRKSREEREVRLFLARHSSIARDEQPVDFLYERYSLWHTAGLVRARELQVPFVLEVNSPLPEEAQRFRSLANEPLARGIAQLLLREADGIVCVSEEVASWVVSLRGHDEGVRVVLNGVNPDIFSPQICERPDFLPPGRPIVAFAGSFRPWHGLDGLLEAFERLLSQEKVEAELLCIGDGPMRRPFEEEVQARGLSKRVHVTGQISQEEVSRYLSFATLAVAPYPDLEGFYFSPLKIFEFLAMGLPVVASDIGQVRTLVPHRRHGLLCPAGDPGLLAAALAELLRDPQAARAMGKAGREWVLREATWRIRVREILALIEEVSCHS